MSPLLILLDKSCGEVKGGEVKGGEVKGGEVKGGEVKGGEVKGGEVKGGEVKGRATVQIFEKSLTEITLKLLRDTVPEPATAPTQLQFLHPMETLHPSRLHALSAP